MDARRYHDDIESHRRALLDCERRGGDVLALCEQLVERGWWRPVWERAQRLLDASEVQVEERARVVSTHRTSSTLEVDGARMGRMVRERLDGRSGMHRDGDLLDSLRYAYEANARGARPLVIVDEPVILRQVIGYDPGDELRVHATRQRGRGAHGDGAR